MDYFSVFYFTLGGGRVGQDCSPCEGRTEAVVVQVYQNNLSQQKLPVTLSTSFSNSIRSTLQPSKALE
jgi:hypothetical protein